ncbi:ras-related protein Rab-33B-like [Alosa sapidissima]|uniref:ras-related protein Rab-33B-like n=1 Tax=Alosa sapidissima TaxID=34773 RepID=UPI001C09C4BB|nr:ras-related protein Rab-33B-like [Alosa sapidissima]
MESSTEFSTSLAGSSQATRYRIFKIVVIGDSGVGKTCLAYRFCAGKFPDKTEATIGVDFRERILDIEGEKIKVQLWDTAGQERFRKSMVQQYYRSVHAVVLVFDVSNPASFRSLPLWLEECRRNALGQQVPRILVGNKCDLVQGCSVWGGVTSEQVRRFAEANGMPFYQTSAKGPEGQGDHVSAIFVSLAHSLRRQRTCPSPQTEALGSFKLPSKKHAEKEKWACSC